jgi:hypothetical protein
VAVYVSPTGNDTLNTGTQSSPFLTIQAAINDAEANGTGTVIVEPGTYSAVGDYNLDFGGQDLTLKSANGAASTIIELSGGNLNNDSKTFILFTNPENPSETAGLYSNTVVQGFTIQDGIYDPGGGGILISDTNPTIKQCVFVNDSSAASGGAILIASSNEATAPTITQCTFEDNVAGNENEPFFQLTSTDSGFGGAIECVVNVSSPVTASITDCVFVDNLATYDGAAIDCSGATVNITNCSFFGNEADGYVAPDEDGFISGPSGGTEPGTVDCFEGSVTLTNCVLFHPTGGVEISTLAGDNSNPSDTGPGLSASFTDSDEGLTNGVDDNIVANPDYSSTNTSAPDLLDIAPNSPAIGAGTSTGAPAVDILGNPFGNNVNMGAYAFVSAATHLVVSAPSNATAGTPVSVTVTAEDQFDNTVAGYTGTVHFTSSDGAAVLPANTTFTGGTRSFNVTLNTPGSQMVTATDTVTSSITGNSNPISVSAGAATHFVVTANPTLTNAGTAVTVTVTAEDASDNVAVGYGGVVHFTSSDGAALLPANSTLTNGTGSFSVTFETGGGQTVTATDTVNSAITGTSNSVSVTGIAKNVTGQITATQGGYTFQRATGEYLQSVTLTNTGGSAITGPISLVLDNLVGATLVNATGTTSLATPAGSPYVNGAPGGLAPGASVSIVLDFSKRPTSYTIRVLAGSGLR